MLQLRDNIHWCNSGGRAIFLDVESDRYFCLPAATNDLFLSYANGELRETDAQLLAPLVASGILVESSRSGRIRQPPAIDFPERDLADKPEAFPRLFAIARQLLCEIHSARLLRTKSFAQVLERVERNKVHHRRRPRERDGALEAIAAAARGASYVMRVQDRCLVRALAVHALCARSGIRPTLVFGVIAHPFAAHCWVQVGKAMIAGGIEQARLYAPILVLE